METSVSRARRLASAGGRVASARGPVASASGRIAWIGLVTGLLGAAGAIRLAAQDAVVAPGEKVRLAISGVDGPRVTGIVSRFGPDSIVLRVSEESAPRVIPRSAVQRLEVSTGRRGHARTGALVGLALGAATLALCDDSDSFYQYCPQGAGEVALWVGASAGWGALIGLLVRSDRWQEIAIADAVEVRPGALTVSVRLP